MSELIYVGNIELGESTDITDPCYDRGVWYRVKVKTLPGTYRCYIEHPEGNERHIARSAIVHESIPNAAVLTHVDWHKNGVIARIGVDAGLAGYFNNKPDFSREEWTDLCDNTFTIDKEHFFVPTSSGTGFATTSGWGDGVYDVEGIRSPCGEGYAALRITFI